MEETARLNLEDHSEMETPEPNNQCKQQLNTSKLDC